MEPAAESALTLRDAANQLGVTPQRVSQLLASAELTGPTYEGKHAPKDAGRVWASSLAALISRRVQGLRRSDQTRAAPDGIVERVAAVEEAVAAIGRVDSATEALVRRERAARQVALQMKVESDVLRGQLAQERGRTADLAQKVASLQALLLQSEARLEQSESARVSYDQMLATMLSADDISDL